MSSQPTGNISTSSESAGPSSRSRLPVQLKNPDDDVVDQQFESPANPHPSASPSGKNISDVATAATPIKLPFKLSLTLQNTGSVARDHLASERTFLAYVRTSLSFASAGVGASLPPPLGYCRVLGSSSHTYLALVQLFRISVSTSSTGSRVSAVQFARPLGATLISFGIVVLGMGELTNSRISVVKTDDGWGVLVLPQGHCDTLPSSARCPKGSSPPLA